MSKPEFVIRKSDRTPAGSLRTSDVRRIRSKLMAQGFIVVPSDTCYSLAAYAAVDDTHKNINKILSRGNEPISVCAANIEEALKWIDGSNYAAISILEQFTPGPITLVCNPSEWAQGFSRFFSNTIGDKKGNIGIRISDSLIERDVAATSDYLITTPAIRDPNNNHSIVTDFARALEIVESGIAAFGGAGWGAIEGDGFLQVHSTVVKANRDGTVHLIREGAIPLSEIEVAARIIPSTLFDDWG